jgi:hypothetical protein
MKIRDSRPDAFRPRDPVLEMAPWVAGFACLAVCAVAPFSAVFLEAQQNLGSPGMPAPHDAMSWPPLSPLINRKPDANRLLEDSMKLQDNQKQLAEMNLQRHKQMSADAAKLLALASELRTETDVNGKDALSLEALRKVEQIEKLAHGVREKMRGTIAN